MGLAIVKDNNWSDILTLKRKHPEISATGSEAMILWSTNYWDGPLTGILEWNGEKYWFNIVYYLHVPHPEEPEEEIEDRMFFVYRLTDQELKNEEYWNDLFCESMGEHHMYVYKNGVRRRKGATKSGSLFGDKSAANEYYSKAKKERVKLDLGPDRIVGWFID